MMSSTNIAIACQGGGSQTAFTAGVLKAILENQVHRKRNIVSFSGTSGGAICATLAWYAVNKAIHGDGVPSTQRLEAFWQDNSTQSLSDDIVNDFMVGGLRLMEEGLIPHWTLPPDTPYTRSVWPKIAAMLPHQNFYDFKMLLEAHINFAEIAVWNRSKGPALIIGAANVLTGEFKKFNSRNGEINVDALMASAAVPTLFPAVRIGPDAYWDGLFSDNPPTDELLDEKVVGRDYLPDELWIVKINPKTRRTVPVLPGEISDRRNEMIGNKSLEHGLEKIEMINKFLAKGTFAPEYQARYRTVQVRIIEMSADLQERLDYATKLDRNQGFIKSMIADGERRAQSFLQDYGLVG
jgi:NTE family protein